MKYLIITALLLTSCGKTIRSGHDGVSGPVGPAGIPGKMGDVGPIGQTGATGQTGNIGSNGHDGAPGKDGISTTMVKFCPNIPDLYPNSFPEYGLCIASNIYAVYWSESQAFLAKLTPGKYHTTNNGTNCAFIVTANSCAIHWTN